jgi:hypothetical protein
VLRSLSERNRLAATLEWRRGFAVDAATEDLLSAIQGAGEYQLSAADQVGLSREPEREQVERMILALDRAGPLAPAYDSLPLLRTALDRLDQRARAQELRARGLVLRHWDAAQVAAWLGRSFDKPPVQVLYASGPPGIGKSVLLETSVERASEDEPPVLVRLDFDRPGLDVLDLVGLTAELARQVASQLGARGRDLLAARVRSASLSAGTSEGLSASRRLFPSELAASVADAVQSSGRDVLFVLDTLEALRARGETHPPALFRWLDQMVAAGLRPVRVIAAGREDTLEGVPGEPDRVGFHLVVEPLDEGSSGDLMERLGITPSLRRSVAQLASGNPLLLRVAADVMGGAKPEGLDERHSDDIAAAFLNRVLLSRVEDLRLRELLAPGLVVAAINPEVLGRVIPRALRRPELPAAQAMGFFETLSNQTWLVEPDPYAPGFLRMRWPIRSVLLKLLYGAMRAECARLDRAAASWFAARPESWAQGLSTYHRLQLMRVARGTVGISPDSLATFDERMLEDLPPAAKDVMLGLLGRRTSQLRSGGAFPERAPDEERDVRELMGIIEREDWSEGEYVVRGQLGDGAAVDPRSMTADALRAFWWRSGRWARAREWMLEQERLAGYAAGPANGPPMLLSAQIELEAEFEPGRLADRFRRHPGTLEDAGELTRRSTDDVGKAGALGLIAAPHLGSNQRWRTGSGIPLSDAVISYYVTGQGWSSVLDGALGRARELMAAAGVEDVPERLDAVIVARQLAVLTPYVTPALTLSTLPDHQWLTDDAAKLATRLAERGAMLPWEGKVVLRSHEHPIIAISHLGLFAEWVQSAAYFSRSADLRLIGRSAEAWRRTVAGDWRYGRRPSGWPGRPVDFTIADRFTSLRESPDPPGAALEQLSLWSGGARLEAEALWAELARRTAADWNKAPDEVLRGLLGRRLPSSFVPPALLLRMWRGGI